MDEFLAAAKNMSPLPDIGPSDSYFEAVTMAQVSGYLPQIITAKMIGLKLHLQLIHNSENQS